MAQRKARLQVQSLGLVAQLREPEHTSWRTWGVPGGKRGTVAGSSEVCPRQQKK